MVLRRKCTMCGRILPLTKQHFHVAGKEGYYFHKCKKCRNRERQGNRRPRSLEDKMYARARSRASAALRRMHPQDFEVLMNREMDVELNKLQTER